MTVAYFSTRRLSRRWLVSAVALILAAHLSLLSYCAVSKSVCVDERGHLAAGLAYLKYHEFGIYDLSPPLARLWMALPTYLEGTADIPPAKRYEDMPARMRHWMYATEFESFNWPRLQHYVVMGRFMAIPLSLLMAFMVFYWSRAIYGDVPALVACCAWSFSPVVLAHGSIVGTDMPIALLMFLAVGAWWSFLCRIDHETPATFGMLFLAGLATGAANATKFTGLLLGPLLVLIGAIEIIRRFRANQPTRWQRQVSGLLVCGIMTFVVLNASTEFRLMGDQLGKFEFHSALMKSVQMHLPSWLPIPLHRAVVEGFDAQKWETEDLYTTTLFNRAYFGTNWLYYPWCFLTKNTVGGLALALLAVISLAWRRIRYNEWPLIVAAIGAGLGMYLTARINIGLRYMLPVYPAAAVLLSRSIKVRALRGIAAVACIATIVETTSNAPRFHSFSNWLATPWRSVVPDLDFGQSLLDLKKWIRDSGQSRICLLSFTSIVPYNIPADDALAGPPKTKYTAISRNALTGLPFHSTTHFYFVRGWRKLRDLKPVADLGGIEVFNSEDVIHSAPDGGPWVSEVYSWEDAMRDPALIPIDNFDARKAKGM